MKNTIRLFLDLTKSGIVCFVLVSGIAGYALSLAPGEPWQPIQVVLTLCTLYFLSAGSFAINQAQEWSIDRQMKRTESRPIPSGQISRTQAWMLGLGFILLGTLASLLLGVRVTVLGLITVVLYNGMYTLYWKRKWAFGAVPGAIPGAMPVVIGFAAGSADLWRPELLYAFMILFLWQMPHFWSLAIRFKKDYEDGGIPVLPVCIGTGPTLFHMGLYLFAYVALALASPWFTSVYFLYLLVVIPFALKVLYEFLMYFRAGAQSRWLRFFLWTNFSVLVFLIVPVLDRWAKFVSFGYGNG